MPRPERQWGKVFFLKSEQVSHDFKSEYGNKRLIWRVLQSEIQIGNAPANFNLSGDGDRFSELSRYLRCYVTDHSASRSPINKAARLVASCMDDRLIVSPGP